MASSSAATSNHNDGNATKGNAGKEGDNGFNIENETRTDTDVNTRVFPHLLIDL